MTQVDSMCPQAVSLRSKRVFRAGIGPHAEDTAVRMTVERMRLTNADRYAHLLCGVPYPGSKQKCDLAIGLPPSFAAEVKMARLSGDNGKPDDTAIKDLLSPFPVDRSAVTDCVKLLSFGLSTSVAVIIYGFDDVRRPLMRALDAFERLAAGGVRLGERHTHALEGLTHPIFSSGLVAGWTVDPL